MMHTLERPVVLITGSADPLGLALRSALGATCQVIGFDIRHPRPCSWDGQRMYCDLTSDLSTNTALAYLRKRAGHRIDAVVHLASIPLDSATSFHAAPQVDPRTARLLQQLTNFQVDLLIHASSVAVLQPQASTLSAESHWLTAQKLATERMVMHEAPAERTVIVRLARLYGTDHACHSLASCIHSAAQQQLPALAPGNASRQGQAFVHCEDATRLLARLVQARNRLDSHALYVVGEKPLISHRHLLQQLHTILGQLRSVASLPRSTELSRPADRLAPPGSRIWDWALPVPHPEYETAVAQTEQQCGWAATQKLLDSLPQLVPRILQQRRRQDRPSLGASAPMNLPSR